MINSTWKEDGSRRWMNPRLSTGRFWKARQITAYALIAVFTLLPYLRIGGKPAILLDIANREFTLFGFTFLPTDTLLLALLMLSLIIGIFLITALFGRVWCGWMCPQTVYMEFVYRPLDRLFDGPPGARHRPGKKGTPVRTVAKYALFLVISAFLAHTFLAYFVGVENLTRWMRQSPLEHPVPFLVMLGTTGLMMFDFSYFREQTCIVACPYGRFQSVMLDRDSLIVSYDQQRGEPRGRGKDRQVDGAPLGDCIECGMCTDTCPTGIDIREGLQLECIACTQCIDACDQVMERVGKPRGLIRFSSQSRIEGNTGRLVRLRVIIYPAIMFVLFTTFVLTLANKKSADVTLLRGPGMPFNKMPSGEIMNQIRIKIRNRSGDDADYKIEVVDEIPVQMTIQENPMLIPNGQSRDQIVLIALPRDVFQDGHYYLTLRITDGKDFDQQFRYRLQGPRGVATASLKTIETEGTQPTVLSAFTSVGSDPVYGFRQSLGGLYSRHGSPTSHSIRWRDLPLHGAW